MVRRRRRLLVMAGAAMLAALVAALSVTGYTDAVDERFGPLRPVLVTTAPIEAGRELTPKVIRASTQIRRIPSRFVPAGTLTGTASAIGLQAVAGVPPGAYLASGMLRAPGSARNRSGGRPFAGLHPVEVTVQGAGAIESGRGRFEVLVTPIGGRGGTGRTRVISRSAAILSRGPVGESEAGSTSASVTLAVSRREAIRLIDAEAGGERLTLLPVRGR